MRSMTRPMTTLRSAKAFSTSSQTFIFSAFSRERTMWPSRSSVRSSSTSTVSPGFTMTSPFSSRNSSRGIMPSDLKPTSTITAEAETDRTVPLTTSPSVMFRKLLSYRSSRLANSAESTSSS